MRLTALAMAGFLVSTVLIPDRAPRAAAPPAACTTPTDACARWITLGGGPGRTMVYATHALGTRNDTIKRALIMVHGTNRNADHYFATATAAAFLAGALDNTIVIAPHIVTAQDTLAQNEIAWPGGGDSWRAGGASTSHPGLFAFDGVDELLRKLATKSVFPNMQAIVVTGHSAGGQYATRYAMANKCAAGSARDPMWCRIRKPMRGPIIQHCRGREPAAADGWNLMPDCPLIRYGQPTVARNARAATVAARPQVGRRATHRNRPTSNSKQLVSGVAACLLGRVDTAARRLRQLWRDGAGTDGAIARRGVREIREHDARRASHDSNRARVRPQRPLHLHDRHRVSGDFSDGEIGDENEPRLLFLSLQVREPSHVTGFWRDSSAARGVL
jgi:pimeloyl-ACP methyl ester carboxylesterase